MIKQSEYVLSFSKKLGMYLPSLLKLFFRAYHKEMRDAENIAAFTDGTTICYGKVFFEQFNQNVQLFVIAHELLHILFRHVNRGKQQNVNFQLMNLIADAFINEALAEILPASASDFDGVDFNVLEKILATKLDNAAEVVEEIKKLDVIEATLYVQKLINQQDQANGLNSLDSKLKDSSNNNGNNGHGKNNKGNQQNQNGKNKTKDKDQEFKDALNKYSDLEYKELEESKEFKEELRKNGDNMADAVEEYRMRQLADEIHKEAAKSGHSKLQRLIEKFKVKKIDWKRFIRNEIASQFTLKRVEERAKAPKPYIRNKVCNIPATWSPQYKYDLQKKVSILIAVDVSGSVGSEFVSLGISYIQELHKTNNFALTLMVFTCTIAFTKELKRNEKIDQKWFAYSGGTDFKLVKEFADKGRYDTIFVFTDLCDADVDMRPHNTIWITDKQNHREIPKTMGKTLVIS